MRATFGPFWSSPKRATIVAPTASSSAFMPLEPPTILKPSYPSAPREAFAPPASTVRWGLGENVPGVVPAMPGLGYKHIPYQGLGPMIPAPGAVGSGAAMRPPVPGTIRSGAAVLQPAPSVGANNAAALPPVAAPPPAILPRPQPVVPPLAGQLYDPRSRRIGVSVASEPKGWMPPSVAPTSYGVQFPDSTIPHPDYVTAADNIERLNAIRDGHQIPSTPASQGPFMEAMESNKPLRMDPVVQDALHGQFVHLTSTITGLQNRVASLVEERERVRPLNGILTGNALSTHGAPLLPTRVRPHT